MGLHTPARSDIDAVQAVGLQHCWDVEVAWHGILGTRESKSPALCAPADRFATVMTVLHGKKPRSPQAALK
jgi:hypothetical protein